MVTTKYLSISVPRPCAEKWEQMKDEKNGKFCDACQKVVIDFSYFSDADLHHYFSTVETIPCGRFHSDQLRKPLLPANQNKNHKSFLFRPIAALLTLLLMKQSGSGMIKKEIPASISPDNKIKTRDLLKEKNIVSGSVKDGDGNPLENAEIVLEGKLMAKTNKEGRFTIEVPGNTMPKSILLQIGYPGMNTAVRNYHPSMQSTTYDIVLYPPGQLTSYFMGIPAINEENFPSTVICFKKNDRSLSKDAESSLAILAVKLRNNPGIVVHIVINDTKAEQSTNKTMQMAIKKFLSNNEGISESRLLYSDETGSTPTPYSIVIKASRGEYE